jgi:hypothetical protein
MKETSSDFHRQRQTEIKSTRPWVSNHPDYGLIPFGVDALLAARGQKGKRA